MLKEQTKRKRERLVRLIIAVAKDRGYPITKTDALATIKSLGGWKAAEADHWYDTLKNYFN